MHRADILLAAAFAAYAALQVWVLGEQGDLLSTRVGGPAWWSGPCLVAAGAALAWRRSAPVWSAAGVSAAIALQAATGEAPEGLVVSGPALVAAYSVAAHAAGRRALAGLALLAAAAVAHTAGDPLIRTAADVDEASFWWLLLAATWIAGVAVRRRREAGRLRARAGALERERDEAAARERTRMARELHDVVAHGVSVIALQAGAAQEGLEGDRERTRERLAAIERTARDSASDLRRMLGVLRDDHGEPAAGPPDAGRAAREPAPGLRDVATLVERVRAAGLPVSLVIDGDCGHVPPGVELSAFRVVQEGLTNAVKHARASRVEVAVRHRDAGLEVCVADDGAGADAPASPPGYGLAGLRERVALHGGRLESGPREHGGFLLRAHLPTT